MLQWFFIVPSVGLSLFSWVSVFCLAGKGCRGEKNLMVMPAGHVYYMSGDAWKQGGIDATGALMVLTLKVISCAVNYNDGLLKEEDLREAQKKKSVN
ncbi:hypothetical protein PVK06_018459 [Gossypium arboreum]|uniref:Uncharacterized protein n=1 Tax=Gossypium arboreum TaxID=29729 RepID=A0ABR0Q6C0_GOSAR|nr:hypothetical protein PVK06_018459 [Gossypium arboreum]